MNYKAANIATHIIDLMNSVWFKISCPESVEKERIQNLKKQIGNFNKSDLRDFDDILSQLPEIEEVKQIKAFLDETFGPKE